MYILILAEAKKYCVFMNSGSSLGRMDARNGRSYSIKHSTGIAMLKVYHKIMDMRSFHYLLQVLILDFSFKLEICRIFFPDDLILKIFDYDSTNPVSVFIDLVAVPGIRPSFEDLNYPASGQKSDPAQITNKIVIRL